MSDAGAEKIVDWFDDMLDMPLSKMARRHAIDMTIGMITAHTEAALLADRIARHDETVAAIEAAVKEIEEKSAGRCLRCHGHLDDRMALHLQAEVAESERVRDLTARLAAAVKVERERIRQKAASVGIDVQSWPFWTVLEDS